MVVVDDSDTTEEVMEVSSVDGVTDERIQVPLMLEKGATPVRADVVIVRLVDGRTAGIVGMVEVSE